MLEIAPRIVVDPDVRHGKPVIKGTRVTVATVVAHLGADWDLPRVCEEFAIEREDILAALRYAAQTLEEEETHAVR